jgi:hypothetical protein
MRKPPETFEGLPCRRAGHTERYRSTGKCVQCQREHLTRRHRAFQKRRGPTKPQRAALARARRPTTPHPPKLLRFSAGILSKETRPCY